MTTKKPATSPGEPFVKARRKARLTRADICERLHIENEIIKAIDDWDFENLPEMSQPLSIVIRRYARLLDLSSATFEEQLPDKLKTPSSRFKKPRKLLFVSRFSYFFTATIIVALFLAFISWKTFSANAIPELNIWYPDVDARIDESRIEVTGSTNEGAQVFINGITVPVETDGRFIGSVVLQPGLNKIEIRAINSFAREHVIERVVVRKR